MVLAQPRTTASTPLADDELTITTVDGSLYSEDLAPVPARSRRWGSFEVFNVWTNDVQSLAGYTLAASLFITVGINGWFDLAAIVLAGAVVMGLVNLSGEPSVKHGIPHPVMARAAMGVRGARSPALVRGLVGIFWYGAQTSFASTAVALAITAVAGPAGGGTFLGMTGVDWISCVVVAALQVALFLRGLDGITRFLDVAGPAVYAVMVVLLVAIWVRAGSGLLGAAGSLFAGERTGGAAVIINFGDFARSSRSGRAMRRGNLLGLPVSLAFFTSLSLSITAGGYLVHQGGEGEPLTNPADTVGTNLVANFVPPADDIANLAPSRIGFRTAGTITAVIGFVLGALWVAAIGEAGLPRLVDTLGALLAPLYGIVIADHHLLRRRRLDVQALYSADPGGAHHCSKGCNTRALAAFAVAAVFSVTTVWVPALSSLSGFAWVLGAVVGGGLHLLAMRGQQLITSDADR